MANAFFRFCGLVLAWCIRFVRVRLVFWPFFTPFAISVCLLELSCCVVVVVYVVVLRRRERRCAPTMRAGAVTPQTQLRNCFSGSTFFTQVCLSTLSSNFSVNPDLPGSLVSPRQHDTRTLTTCTLTCLPSSMTLVACIPLAIPAVAYAISPQPSLLRGRLNPLTSTNIVVVLKSCAVLSSRGSVGGTRTTAVLRAEQQGQPRPDHHPRSGTPSAGRGGSSARNGVDSSTVP